MARLRCGECGEYVYFEDYVCLDALNTITHFKCYTGQFPKRDTGTYMEMLYRYDFFDELRPFFPVYKNEIVRHFIYVKKPEENDTHS